MLHHIRTKDKLVLEEIVCTLVDLVQWLRSVAAFMLPFLGQQHIKQADLHITLN